MLDKNIRVYIIVLNTYIMKKYIIFLFLLLLSSCSFLNIDEDTSFRSIISDSRIYFFYLENSKCCKEAREYINQNHPLVLVKYVDMAKEEGEKLMLVAQREYHLSGSVSAPLICCGRHYIEGWNEEKKAEFELMIEEREHP